MSLKIFVEKRTMFAMNKQLTFVRVFKSNVVVGQIDGDQTKLSEAKMKLY